MKTRFRLRILLAVIGGCCLLASTISFSQRAPVPPATGAMLEIANQLVESINAQDAAKLTKMVAPDAVYLDEDGHALRVNYWIRVLTTGTPPKKVTISEIHGESWETAGWVSFNYTIAESLKGAPLTIRGTASITVKKSPGTSEWQIALIHGALDQRVEGVTQ